MSVADLDIPTVVDAAARTVRVAGGTRFAQLALELDAQGWALPNLGSLPHISVAGACATGTHGSGNDNRCLAAGVVGVEFVRGDGELVTVTRDDPDFGGSVVALGALGVVTALTLELTPSFELAPGRLARQPARRRPRPTAVDHGRGLQRQPVHQLGAART